jgi:hypothetical protein
MTFKIEICFVLLALLSQLFFFAYAAADSLETSGDDALKQDVLLPTLVAERDRHAVVSFFPVIIEGEDAGMVAVYKDPATERPADYWEFYDLEGNLVAASWFDRFGIAHMAVDRGLLEDISAKRRPSFLRPVT